MSPPAAASCVVCGTELPPAAKFCPECAHPVAAFTAISGARDRGARSLAAPRRLEGERKLVTVLFADLKGSLELIADRDPEEARKLLDPVIEHMCEAVEKYGGTVSQVMGDGILALFGAPVSWEDHAVRACHAALSHAGPRPPLWRRHPARVWRAGADSHRAQFRRSRAERQRPRPLHELHRGRPDRAHRRADGTDGEARLGARDGRDGSAGGGLHRSADRSARSSSRASSGRSRSPRSVARPTRRSRFDRAPARAMTPFMGRDAELHKLLDAFDEVARESHRPHRHRRRRGRDRQIAPRARIPARGRSQETRSRSTAAPRRTAAVPGIGRACTSCASISTSPTPTTSRSSRRKSRAGS